MKSLSFLSTRGKSPFFPLIFVSLLSVNFGIAQEASFTADVTSGCFPLTVKFTDTSTGTITSWEWDFGNGNSSIQQNPGAVYASPGMYTVSLKVSNGSQTDTEIKTAFIRVHDYPTVDFSFDKATGCAPLTVKFADESTAGSGAITDWLWAFSDGGSGIVSNPEHTFTSGGNISVSLKVTNSFGCARTAAKASVINVSGPAAEFTASSTSVCQVPATIQFTNESTGSGMLTYAWDFGDGTSSVQEEPSHNYTIPGTYPVLLKVSDEQGCESSHSVTIHAGSGGGLSFEPSADKVCAGESITFASYADSPVISREWDFGNNTSSTDENPSVTYSNEGNYVVTLTSLLVGKTCESVVTRTIEVIALPVSSFTHETDCDYNATLTNTSLHASRVEWYIQDALVSTQPSFTHSFPFSGGQLVRLIAYNSLNCSDTLDLVVGIPAKPFASFSPSLEQDCVEPSLSGCAPFLLQLKNHSVSSSSNFTSIWDFGDSTKTTEKDPAHIYSAKGTYTLKLTITNADGCSSSMSAKVTVADEIPVAKFIYNKAVVCPREEVTFTDQSENATFWCWDFGDDNTAIGKDATHSYSKPGVYTVTLTVRNAGCSDTEVIQNAIEVKDPYIDFTIEKDCSDPYTISIQNLSSGYDSLEWDFGDGTISVTDETSHHFSSTGSYDVKLKGSNADAGCTTGMSIPVTIQEIQADFEMDNPNPCKGEVVTFTDKSEAAVRWHWAFGSQVISNLQHPAVFFSESATHDIVLSAFDSDGCMDQKVLTLKVLDIQGNFMYTATSSCDELTADFTDLSTPSSSISGWLWDFGDGETSTMQNPQHVYTSPGEYTVNLTLTTNEGSCTFIRDRAVAFTVPVPDFFPVKEGACIMEKVTLNNVSTSAISFEWDFGDGRTATDIHTQIDYPAPGKYTISLTATDGYGCAKSISKTEVISITQPVADFEAFETSSECPPLISIFQDKSTGDITQWHWDFGNEAFSVLKDPVYTYLDPGTFDVKLKVTDINGCTDSTKQEQLITIGGPYGSFTSGIPENSCINQTVPFSAVTSNATNHRWDYGDGTVEDMGTETQAYHTYTSLGSYNTSLVLIDDKGCEVVAKGDVRVIVNDTTKIDFTYSPECIFEGETFVLEAVAGEDDITFEWMIGDQQVGTTPALSLALDTANQHKVTLRAINQYGCPSAISHTVPVHGPLTLIPNVFTPNNDGRNTYFMMESIENSKWNISIYNRYGSPVYEKENYTNDWDGGDLPSGVYYYSVINSFCRDRRYKGVISILR